MRKRNCRVEIYFTRGELDSLTKKVRRSGLSREGYCRRVLNESEVKAAPPADLRACWMCPSFVLLWKTIVPSKN